MTNGKITLKIFTTGVPAQYRGTHLHFGLKENSTFYNNGEWVDPMPYLMGIKTIGSNSAPDTKETAVNYLVQTQANLNIRKGAGTNFSVADTIRGNGVYTIVSESDGVGAKKWGKLQNGKGWISLDYTLRVSHSDAPVNNTSIKTNIVNLLYFLPIK